jgi:hypothetical protein
MERREPMTVQSALVLVFVAFVAGCQTRPKPLYYWGNYQGIVYQDYSSPGKASPEQQIESLKADLEKAKSANLPAPPGLHAHLGYLYGKIGKSDLALREFQTEKELFPESATFIDGLLTRSQAAPKP